MKKYLALLLVLAVAPLSQAELLNNPCFEDNGGSLDGWLSWGGGSGIDKLW